MVDLRTDETRAIEEKYEALRELIADTKEPNVTELEELTESLRRFADVLSAQDEGKAGLILRGAADKLDALEHSVKTLEQQQVELLKRIKALLLECDTRPKGPAAAHQGDCR